MQISTTLVTAPSRVRQATFVALAVCLAAIVAACVIVVAGLTTSFATAPFSPRVEDGHIPEGAAVSLDDDHLPAIGELDPALLGAMREAATAAAGAGLDVPVTSGWRSAAYQDWLLGVAVETYGSEDVARQFVATPEESSHVTGEAVDIGSVDAQSWLSQHGAEYGLCQVYANEPWHYERLIEPGEVCPDMVPDASSQRGS
ncbi:MULTISPECIES: M15 family metallopeptidase [Microbacterium]|uniref:D-alanyl-D-alanine carboxypeptidase n=1 Tax=Microbacterium wangchenii TaxID=2541726 RepID=A0ABX5SRS8_9MICO|nr:MULTISPECIES: M15 family metallopeptidase [Microbacterium]MCK6065050.1 M15 family metallopeptidase [Microbacterium sp. EYE_512]QBR88517.1 D-alanyl-D-alanine carboxypeptidase [Microbacterium wangchenii]